MKTKTISKISALLLVVLLCLLALVGCTPNLEMPATESAVTGNGGLAVQKGEYIYFVNGYKSATSLQSGENNGGVEYSAIYRTKLENGELVYEDGKLKNCELVIDKVCGFEKTALYIFDDYIYYTSPNTQKIVKDEALSNNFELTDFYRAKLDGTEVTLLYKTVRTSDSTDYAFFKDTASNNVYLVVYDGTALLTVNCSNKEVKEVCESVSSVAIPKYTDYAQNNQITLGAMNIYYTRSATDEENLANGNVLCYAKITEGEENIIAFGDDNTYTVKFATNEALVYTKKGAYDLNANNYVISYAYDAENKLAIDVQNGGIQLDATANSDLYLCTFENGNQTGIIIKNSSNKLVYINYQTGNYKILDSEKELTPLCVYGTKVYAYASDNSLYQIDYKNPENKKVLIDMSGDEDSLNTPYFSAKKNFSVCGTYVYYFATYKGDTETGYYLNRVKTVVSDTYTAELVGVVQQNHIQTEE